MHAEDANICVDSGRSSIKISTFSTILLNCRTLISVRSVGDRQLKYHFNHWAWLAFYIANYAGKIGVRSAKKMAGAPPRWKHLHTQHVRRNTHNNMTTHFFIILSEQHAGADFSQVPPKLRQSQSIAKNQPENCPEPADKQPCNQARRNAQSVWIIE